MDKDTKSKLEAIRPRVPRYLFRAWNDTPGLGRVSGGRKGLNSPEAITPLAFFLGGGSKTVYDLSKEEFTEMAQGHLFGNFMKTELSSWASSLGFALSNIAAHSLGGRRNKVTWDYIYISIIDTKELWDANQFFYVPDLAFLGPHMRTYTHEYLAHGVITGTAHKALPLKVFCDAGIGFNRIQSAPSSFKVSSESVRKARQVGDQYGGEFALPMCLAVLCRKQRDIEFFRERVREIDVIFAGIHDLLPAPQKWADDKAIQPDAVYVQGYEDVEQMCRLMRALLELPKANEPEKKQTHYAVTPVGETKPTAGRKRKRPKREAAMEDQPRYDAVEKKNEEEDVRKRLKRMEREMKRLEIDMAH